MEDIKARSAIVKSFPHTYDDSDTSRSTTSHDFSSNFEHFTKNTGSNNKQTRLKIFNALKNKRELIRTRLIKPFGYNLSIFPNSSTKQPLRT